MDAQTLAMIAIIVNIILVSIFGVILALFSYFLDFCFWDGNIFGKWLPFVAKTILKRKDKLKYDYVCKSPEEQQDQLFINSVEKQPFYKVLGGCSICLNIWIGFATYPVIAYFTGFSYWYMIIYLMVASFTLRKIMKID